MTASAIIEISRRQMMRKCVITDNLLENKHTISDILCEKNKSGIFVLHDTMNLSPSETIQLCKQFVSINSSEDFQRFCICVIVGWIESYRNQIENYFTENMKHRLKRIPQHARGKYLKIYLDTFYEYGLDTFSLPFDNLDNIELAIKKHAGIE